LTAFGLILAVYSVVLTYASHLLAHEEIAAAIVPDISPSGNAWMPVALNHARVDRVEIVFMSVSTLLLLMGIGFIGDAMRGQPERPTAGETSPFEQSADGFRWRHNHASRDVIFP
jgi:hypothetical protein